MGTYENTHDGRVYNRIDGYDTGSGNYPQIWKGMDAGTNTLMLTTPHVGTLYRVYQQCYLILKLVN